MKSVIIAFANPLLTNWITTILNRAGYTIEYSLKTAGDVIRVADFCTSPVLVTGFQFPDMNAIDLMSVLDGRLAMVAILLPHQRDMVGRDEMVTVPYPLTSVELLQAIELVEREAAERAAGQCRGTSTTRLGPKDRPAEEKLLILKAKTILMDNLAMTESQAHRFLQKTSMDRGLRLTDAARMVIENSLTP